MTVTEVFFFNFVVLDTDFIILFNHSYDMNKIAAFSILHRKSCTTVFYPRIDLLMQFIMQYIIFLKMIFNLYMT